MNEKIQATLEKALTVLSAKLDKDDITIDDVNKIVYIVKAVAQRDTGDMLSRYCDLALQKQFGEPTDTATATTTDKPLI